MLLDCGRCLVRLSTACCAAGSSEEEVVRGRPAVRTCVHTKDGGSWRPGRPRQRHSYCCTCIGAGLWGTSCLRMDNAARCCKAMWRGTSRCGHARCQLALLLAKNRYKRSCLFLLSLRSQLTQEQYYGSAAPEAQGLRSGPESSVVSRRSCRVRFDALKPYGRAG